MDREGNLWTYTHEAQVQDTFIFYNLTRIDSPDGAFEVYVYDYQAGGGTRRISRAGGSEPAFSPDGRELFYRDGKNVMVVPVLSGVGDPFGEPRVLFADDYLFAGYQYRSGYDITPDGQSFVFVKQVEDRAAPSIHVWSDVFGELKRVAPSR